jgi:hypothetical protein
MELGPAALLPDEDGYGSLVPRAEALSESIELAVARCP